MGAPFAISLGATADATGPAELDGLGTNGIIAYTYVSAPCTFKSATLRVSRGSTRGTDADNKFTLKVCALADGNYVSDQVDLSDEVVLCDFTGEASIQVTEHDVVTILPSSPFRLRAGSGVVIVATPTGDPDDDGVLPKVQLLDWQFEPVT
jgi:hypothetical protein